MYGGEPSLLGIALKRSPLPGIGTENTCSRQKERLSKANQTAARWADKRPGGSQARGHSPALRETAYLKLRDFQIMPS